MKNQGKQKELAKSQRKWGESLEGTFALEQSKKLIHKLIASGAEAWLERDSSLLDVACGSGAFLELFLDLGFDVTGLDASPDALEQARARLGYKADLKLGVAEHLPFENCSFDYVSILSALEYIQEPELAISEALRVASKGVLIGFLNPWSLDLLYRKISADKQARSYLGYKQPLHSFSPLKMYKLVSAASPCSKLMLRSALLGPKSSWGKGGLWDKLGCSFLPVGAFTVMRVDLPPTLSMRPLWLKAGGSFNSAVSAKSFISFLLNILLRR